MKSPYAKGRAPTWCSSTASTTARNGVLFAGAELSFRGFHTLAIDGPGQGESLRLRNIPARYDYERRQRRRTNTLRAAATSIRLASRSGRTAGRLLRAARGGVRKTIRGLHRGGPHYDYHANWEKRWAAMKKDGNSVATSHFQLPWVLGVADMDAAMENSGSSRSRGWPIRSPAPC